MRWTEEDLKNITSNTKKTATDPDWVSPRTVKPSRVKGGKSINQHIDEVITSIRLSKFEGSASGNHLAMTFDGARILTLNEIIAVLPYQPYLIYNYKKAWRDKIDQCLLILRSEYGRALPEFTESCIFVGFRRSTRLVDRDGLSPCFKFILDDLRKPIALKEEILKDDNPNLILETPCFQEVGPHLVGIRLERVKNWSEPKISPELILSKEGIGETILKHKQNIEK